MTVASSLPAIGERAVRFTASIVSWTV